MEPKRFTKLGPKVALKKYIIEGVCFLVAVVSLLFIYNMVDEIDAPLREAELREAERNAPGNEEVFSRGAEIIVKKDGDFIVTESYDVKAEGKFIVRGICPFIITSYLSMDGKQKTARYEIMRATRNDKPENFQPEVKDGAVRICLGKKDENLTPGRYRYVLQYLLKNRLEQAENRDEFSWEVPAFGALETRNTLLVVRFPPLIEQKSITIRGFIHGDPTEELTNEEGTPIPTPTPNPSEVLIKYEQNQGEDLQASIWPSRPLLRGEAISVRVLWPPGFTDRAAKLVSPNEASASATAQP